MRKPRKPRIEKGEKPDIDYIGDAPGGPRLNSVINLSNIVSAYISSNKVPIEEISTLIKSVDKTLFDLATEKNTTSTTALLPTKDQIKKSITPDALISFEDGKPYKTLRRHLSIRGVTPEAYRSKYGLPVDYPMTSASYSAQRSELARSLGLGNNRKGQTKAAAKAAGSEETVSEASAQAKPKRAGRPRKAAAPE